MGRAMSATSGPVEMGSMSMEERVKPQYSDAQKRALRYASLSHAADLDLAGEEGVEGPRLMEETHAQLVFRLEQAKRMVPVSVRLDREVLEWLKRKGTGHLERINDILGNVMKAERRMGPGRL